MTRETLGCFMLVKNEAGFIRQWLSHLLPFVDEFALFDGNSTDGTIDIIADFERNHSCGRKINLYQGKDPADLQDSYARMFNDCLHSLRTDWAFFCHPDMEVENPGDIPIFLENSHGKFAAFTKMRSFAGNPGAQLYEIKTGRADRWKNIYRLKNPNLGAYYWGSYGHADEDVYFKAITGNEHKHCGPFLDAYPYEVIDSGLKIKHYSDVRDFNRRFGRMKTSLLNQGKPENRAAELAAIHPRVTLKSGDGFEFAPVEIPEYLKHEVMV